VGREIRGLAENKAGATASSSKAQVTLEVINVADCDG
jgi:hypothetical protein